MKIVLQDNTIIAIHADSQDVAAVYPGGLVLTIPDGTPVVIGQVWAVDLETARMAACAAIDARAEALRLAVLTPGSGQMAAYLAKEEQATALLQDGDPAEAVYPDLYNEVGITAGTVHEVAMAVLAAAERWRLYGRGVEKARLVGKRAVAAAGDPAGVVAARDGVVWPQA